MDHLCYIWGTKISLDEGTNTQAQHSFERGRQTVSHPLTQADFYPVQISLMQTPGRTPLAVSP